MSTRSGKRIHKSLHENILNETSEIDLRIDRKTRSRALKENCDALNVSLPKERKQKNYVQYPADNEPTGNVKECPPVRHLRKTTLKELNIDVTVSSNAVEKDHDDRKDKPVVRLTRRTKKFIDNAGEDHTKLNGESDAIGQTANYVGAPDLVSRGKKSKKNKRKKASSDNEDKTDIEPQVLAPPKKSSKKKKQETRSGSIVVEDIVEMASDEQKSFSTTNTSIESFHSAAGSPDERIKRPTPGKNTKKLNGTFAKSPAEKQEKSDDHGHADTTLTLTKTNKSSLDGKLNISSKNRISNSNPKDSTFDLSEVNITDNTLTKLNSTFDKDKELKTQPQETMEVEVTSKTSDDMDSKDQCNKTQNSNKRMSNRLSKVNALDTTFDKISEISDGSGSKRHNSTYDKIEKNSTSSPARSKSDNTIMSSDNTESTGNVTFDKSDENIFRISLTSDDSKSSSENILNTTPLLIESSMETSKISEVTPKQQTLKKVNKSAEKPANAALTPLKREGTFTKDGPDPIIVTSPMPKTSTDKISTVTTPAKRKMSLPSPGCTPFHSNTKIPPREKCHLNRTHSVEKPVTRRSTLADSTKTTRVMFCSPINNPILNTERKSKIIKSSLKGSNKSFLFEEKASPVPTARPAGRKRSFTHSGAEQGEAKRKRLANDLQTSVERLSRPRTASATAPARPSESSTPAQPHTPGAGAGGRPARSKLPNFAALHQRRFQRMESLDECQQRRAKRARHLLVPTGPLAVLERNSPKASEAPNSATKETETKKWQPLASKTELAKPTHTRFGFKLNLDVNPFSIPSKTPDPKTVENKPSRLVKRQPTQPSLHGGTVRKEVAKQVIMRENATSLRQKRDVVRDETRTIIKGVRTNRRFELQMRSRNING